LRLLLDMTEKTFTSVNSESAEEKSKVLSIARDEFGADFNESEVDLESEWTSYTVRLFDKTTVSRLILFRPLSSSKTLGCIRVISNQNSVKWEVVQKGGIFLGLVPPECTFEAMLVEVKLITQK